MRINKNDYDNVQLTSSRLSPGGHRCIIKAAQEEISRTGKPMIRINFDTDSDDREPQFYTNDYLAQDSMNRKWHGFICVVCSGDYFMKNLKQIGTALKDSNPGFELVAEDGTVRISEMAGKKVGIVFQEEEYLSNRGNIGTSTKPKYFCNVADAYDKPIPDKKLYQAEDAAQPTAFAAPPIATNDPKLANEGFMQVPNGNEEGLPFR